MKLTLIRFIPIQNIQSNNYKTIFRSSGLCFVTPLSYTVQLAKKISCILTEVYCQLNQSD